MLQQTARFIQQVEFLHNAGIHYLPKPDPQFAIMLSYDEASALWCDLQITDRNQRWYYRPLSPDVPSSGHEVVSLEKFDDLPRPPFPTTDHNVWCRIDELTLIIKGRKDA